MLFVQYASLAWKKADVFHIIGDDDDDELFPWFNDDDDELFPWFNLITSTFYF